MRQFAPVVLIFCFLFTTCGIEEYFYLPQIDERNRTESNLLSATIILPQIGSPYYFADGYQIYYKIYLSNASFTSVGESELPLVNSNLNSDYSYFLTLTDPTNTSSTTSASSFSGRQYRLLEFDSGALGITNTIPVSGGTLTINFPTAAGEYPIVNFNGDISLLYRTTELESMPDKDNFYFRYTQQLQTQPNTTDKINIDISTTKPTNANIAYTAMYIVAVGAGANFTRTFSKPTFLSVFRLPDAN